MITLLTNAVVFMGVALTITEAFATTSLGVISKIYKRFTTQRAAIARECCGSAARLASHTSAYLELKDTMTGISEERFLKRYRRIFMNTESLSDEEIQRFCNFVVHGMTPGHEPVVKVEEFGN